MLTMIKDIHTPLRRSAGALALLFLLVFVGTARGQESAALNGNANKTSADKAATSSRPQPIASIYKEVKIGTSADEIRKLLGKGTIDDKDGFFYDKESEMVQIRLDEDAKVKVISVTYTSDARNPPSYADIFSDMPPDSKPDGSIYRLVRYPESGYWIAYSRTGGDKPMVTVTMQKL